MEKKSGDGLGDKTNTVYSLLRFKRGFIHSPCTFTTSYTTFEPCPLNVQCVEFKVSVTELEYNIHNCVFISVQRN